MLLFMQPLEKMQPYNFFWAIECDMQDGKKVGFARERGGCGD